MFKHHKKALIILLLLIAGLFVYKFTDRGEDLSLANVQSSAVSLKQQVDAHYILSILIFIAAYVIMNLWLPAAAVLTLLAGFLFGTIPATLYVLLAATLGALTGYWISGHIIGNWVQRRWHAQLDGLNKQIEEHGYVYLVLVRMIPLMPYSLINYLSGLTKIRPRTIAWTTALGSFPGILIFTYSGRQLLTIKSVDDVLTLKVLVAFCLMVLFVTTVLVIRHILYRKKKQEYESAAEPA